MEAYGKGKITRLPILEGLRSVLASGYNAKNIQEMVNDLRLASFCYSIYLQPHSAEVRLYASRLPQEDKLIIFRSDSHFPSAELPILATADDEKRAEIIMRKRAYKETSRLGFKDPIFENLTL